MSVGYTFLSTVSDTIINPEPMRSRFGSRKITKVSIQFMLIAQRRFIVVFGKQLRIHQILSVRRKAGMQFCMYWRKSLVRMSKSSNFSKSTILLSVSSRRTWLNAGSKIDSSIWCGLSSQLLCLSIERTFSNDAGIGVVIPVSFLYLPDLEVSY